MQNIPSQEDIHCGQAIYTKKNLRIYDLFVTKFSNRFVWKCPRKVIINFYQHNTSQNHLDIGVGTGYFLQQLNLTPGQQRIGLLDLNENCLEVAKKNLQQFNPETYHYDVFEPFISVQKKFDSVSLNYVLHCLPGTLAQKAVVFDHVKDVLNPGGKVFGTTLLGLGTQKNYLAKKLLALYNKKKIMHNLNDNKESLLNELTKRFSQVEININGCVALFTASI